MMARELHDIVSHAVSVIAVQAGAAELSWPIDPPNGPPGHGCHRDRGRADGGRAQQTARPDSVGHQVANLYALVDRMRAAGLDVTLDLSDKTSSTVPETVYRVIQEALTNALGHAPVSRVRVRIDRTADFITVRVADDGPGSAADSRGGYGLIGLADRLRQAGLGTAENRADPTRRRRPRPDRTRQAATRANTSATKAVDRSR